MFETHPRPHRRRVIAAAALLLPIAAQAAIVAQYSFDSGWSSSDTEPLTSASDFLDNASGGSFSAEFGVLTTPPSTSISSQTAAWTARSVRDSSNTWFDFTIGLDAGANAISFSSLTFDAYVFQTLTGPAGFDYRLYWDVDGFASPIGSVSGPSISTATTGSAALSFDLSALPTRTSGVTFRFDPVFASGSQTNGGVTPPAAYQRGGAIDNVILNATITPAQVPVPGTLLLLAAGGLAVTAMRRRQQQRPG